MGNADDPDLDRYRTQAYRTASQRSIPTLEGNPSVFPPYTTAPPTSTQAGGLNNNDWRDVSPAGAIGSDGATPGLQPGGTGDNGRDAEKSTQDDGKDSMPIDAHAPASPPHKSEAASSGDTTIDTAAGDKKKPKSPMTVARMKAGCKRFGVHFKAAIFRSWINVLLIFVPIGIAAKAANLNAGAVFGLNAIAIIPLAGLLAHATEAVASRLGDTWGALLNVSFGNAVELIIFIIALVKNEIRIVQASLLGSILANLLLILGMAFLLGGLRYREQIYNSTVTQMSACLLSLSVMSLLLPTAFHASFNQASQAAANNKVLQVSRGTSIILLFVYVLYLLFQLKSHAYMYESTPQAIIDEESHPGVLADMMNSSSSSDSSSTSDSSDSGSSGSGSVANTTRKMKRMFRRRKSSASSISNGTGPGKMSIVSSPSTQEREDPLSPSNRSFNTSRRGSVLGPLPGDDADADREDNGASRNFDWATRRQLSNEGLDLAKAKKHHKKHSKKKGRKHRHHQQEISVDEKTGQNNDNPPKVEFADEVTVVPGQEFSEEPTTQSSLPRMPFNMRQISSRARPGLSKMMSNNVFVQPAPTVQAAPPRLSVTRSHSAGNLRRTNSLPDRLDRQGPPREQPQTARTDPLPPFQHQRFLIRRGTPELSIAMAEEEDDGQPKVMSRTAATMLLLFSTGLVAICAEFMVSAIPDLIGDGNTVSEAFIGLIILPIVGNAAEHVTAVTVAMKNKMDLAIGVAVGSSIQIALFVTPVVVLLGWILNTSMSLYFNLFETVSLFVTAFVVNFLVLDGRSNYLEGALLIAAYIIIALVAFFYPDASLQSSVGGGAGT